ncbi:MAG: metal-sensitive transcriptional regulator [Dehalococcoidia bacterium]
MSEQEILARLRRIEGQLRGIQKMIEDHRGCEPVLQQMMSARTALDGAAAHVVTTYVDECLAQKPPEEARADIARVIKLLSKVG